MAATELLTNQTLSLLLAQVRGAAPLVPAVTTALAQLRQMSFDAARATREIAEDRALSTRLSRLGQLPWFGRTGADKGPAALVSELGPERTRELLFTLTFVDVLELGPERALLTCHAVGVAAIAHTLAEWSNSVEPTCLGTAALWHDVGRLLFYRSAEVDRAALGSDEEEFPTSSHLIERMRFGFDHAVLGELALRLWGFPDEVSSLVGLHHRHRPPAGMSLVARTALGLLEAADLFEHGFAARDSTQLGRIAGLWARFGLAEALPLGRVRAQWRDLRDARALALESFAANRAVGASRAVADTG